MGDCCSYGNLHLEEGQADGVWDEIRKRSLVGLIGLSFSRCFRLWNVYGCQGQDFGQLARRASIVDESTALPGALDGTKEFRLSYHTATTLCQDFSDIPARPSGWSWREARKAECEFSEVPTSLQRPAGRPL